MRHFKLLADVSPNAILITTPDARITYVNKAWEDLTGYTLQEVKGKNPSLLQSGQTPKAYYEAMWHNLAQGKPFTSESVVNKRKDGSLFQVHTITYPIQKNGATVCFAQVVHDITDRKKLEELKNAFLSIAGHELKTPLTTVKLLTQTMLRSHQANGHTCATLNSLTIIDKETTRLTTIVNDILDISRIETGRLTLRFEQIYLADLLTDVITRMRIILYDFQIVFRHVPNVLMTVAPSRIEQVLVNLISNAVKHSSKGSTIVIQTKLKGDRVTISVKDQGEGIAKEKLPYIFDKFYQAQENPTGGFGLGLFIAKEIVETHKGKIWVQSEPQKGSTFSFSLPRVPQSHS